MFGKRQHETGKVQLLHEKENVPALKMLPPTDQNLFLHTLHAYLHVLLWKTADKNMPPEKAHKITKYGWEITDDNVAMPVISSLPVAPPKLFDSF